MQPKSPEYLCPECERLFGPDQVRCPYDGARLVDVSSGLQPGTVIDHRYTIRHMLGKGGMGSVYVARQHSMDRDVAIKVLHQRSDGNQTSVQRFFWEVRAARRLQSPHTITVFDFGQTERGSLFLAMELLKGVTLGSLLSSRGPLGPGLALSVAIQVCRSLEEAHAHGIIHRDLKPENIFLSERAGDSVFVKVLDFGVAKFLGQDGTSPQTRTGTVFGTPRYMSPEQANSEPVDARSDLYSVGILLYEMLTGHAPFTETNPLEVLYKQVHSAPVPLATAAPALAELPRLSALVDGLLAKRREDRPESAWLVRQELEDILGPLPESLRHVAEIEPPAHATGTHSVADTEESRRVGAQDTSPSPPLAGPVTPSLGVAVARREELAGRKLELGVARRALSLALRDGEPKLLWVTGEPGLGKRRFVEALGHRARADHQGVFARGLHASDQPLASIRSALEDLLKTTLLERRTMLARLETHPAFVDQAAERELLADLVDFLRAPSTTTSPSTLSAIYRMLVRISVLEPIFIDFGHIVPHDVAAIDFLSQLAAQLPQTRARLALAIRVSPPPGRTSALRAVADHLGWRGSLAPEIHTHLPLKRLDGLDFLELTQAIGRGYGHLAPYLHYLSAGNAADALGLIDALESNPDHLAFARGWDPINARIPLNFLPANLVDKAERLLASATEPLARPRDTQTIIRHAAILGPVFDVSVLEHSLERESTRTALEVLEPLIESLVLRGVWLEETHDRMRFDTGLLREIILGRIRSPRTLRSLHTVIAETLSDLPDAPNHLDRIARHWESASAHEEAMESHLRLARADRDAGHINTALEAYRKALDLSALLPGDDGVTSLEILDELGRLGLEARAFDEAIFAYSTLAERARPNERLVADAESGIAQARGGLAEPLDAAALFGSAAARYRALGLTAEAALAERRRATCLADAGLHDAAIDGLEAARALYRTVSDGAGLAAVAATLGALHLDAGRAALALGELRQAALLEADASPAERGRTQHLLALALLASGAPLAALEPARRAIELIDEAKVPADLPASLETLARALLEVERAHEARAFLERALRLHEADGSRHGVARALTGLAECALQLAQPERALELAQRGRALAADEALFDVAARALRVWGLAERALSHHDRALTHLREAVMTCQQLTLRAPELVHALEALSLCEDDLGQSQDARIHLELALAEARARGLSHLIGRLELRLRSRTR